MERAHFEAAVQGDVTCFPFCDIHRQDLSEIFDKVSPLGNSLLHVASSSGQLHITKLIATNFTDLITKKNSEGDTALHFAVRAEEFGTMMELISSARQAPSESLLKIQNYKGNTALHEALLVLMESKKRTSVETIVSMANQLVQADPEVSYCQNNIGKSPLCLAVESGNKRILEYILAVLPQTDRVIDKLGAGRSPVHIAIKKKNCLDILKVIEEKKKDLFILLDEEGNTALHCAASIGDLEGVRYLLDIDINGALKRNKEGLYPLHLASENGHVKVMKELFKKWPDSTEFLCNKGQNILHVAAKSGKENAVKCILKEKCFEKYVNKMDKDGNTPFHLATSYGHSMVVVTLLWNKQSKPDLVNYQGLTAYDACKSSIRDENQQRIDGNLEASKENSVQLELKSSEKANEFQKMMTLAILYVYYELFRRWCIRGGRHYIPTKSSGIKSKAPFPKQDINNRINNLLVVAALIGGAAFAGILQMPLSADILQPDELNADGWESKYGFPRYMLRGYMFGIIMAMNLSITAALILCLALLVDNGLAAILVWGAFVVLELALCSLGNAFAWAMQIRCWTYNLDSVRTKELHSSISFYVVKIVFGSVQGVLVLFPSLTSALGWEVLHMFIYFILFCFYFLLHLSRSIFFRCLKTVLKYGRYVLVLFLISCVGLYLIFY